jgi:hypothetical protein
LPVASCQLEVKIVVVMENLCKAIEILDMEQDAGRFFATKADLIYGELLDHCYDVWCVFHGEMLPRPCLVMEEAEGRTYIVNYRDGCFHAGLYKAGESYYASKHDAFLFFITVRYDYSIEFNSKPVVALPREGGICYEDFVFTFPKGSLYTNNLLSLASLNNALRAFVGCLFGVCSESELDMLLSSPANYADAMKKRLKVSLLRFIRQCIHHQKSMVAIFDYAVSYSGNLKKGGVFPQINYICMSCCFFRMNGVSNVVISTTNFFVDEPDCVNILYNFYAPHMSRCLWKNNNKSSS